MAKSAPRKSAPSSKSTRAAKPAGKSPSTVKVTAKAPTRKAIPERPKGLLRRSTQSPRGAAAVRVIDRTRDDGGAIPAPVPSNDKPRKNQAGFSSRELEHFRDLLLAKRREILGDMSSMEREALRSSGGTNLSTLPIHMADMGTDNYEQEFTLGLVETERKLLREINQALAKIQNGSFGICEGTGKPISKARLEVQPWARYSIEYAKQMERGR